MYNTDFSFDPALEKQRDVFVFQSLVGCRISDLYAMTRRSVINGAVEYIPRKTKDGRPVVVRVPLLKDALEILDRYKTLTLSVPSPVTKRAASPSPATAR